MKQNILQFAKLLGFVAFIVLGFMFSPIVVPFLIGGVIKSGILGGFSGKVGPVVGGKWKDIDYMRSYVIPANPNTAGQQTQRTRFVVIQDYARQVLSSLIQPYWDQYESSQSGYNAIMSNWLLNAGGTNLLGLTCIASKGTLASQGVATASGVNATGVLTITWDEALVGNQLTTDTIKILVFDPISKLLYFEDQAVERGDETTTVNLGAGVTDFDNDFAYVFFSQGSGSSMIISDSFVKACQAA